MSAELDLTVHKHSLEQLYNSDSYRKLERTLTTSNARFENLTASQRLLAIYFLRIAGDHAFEDMWRLFYKRKPPTIEEFLSDTYLPETNKILYPKWRELSHKIFAPGSQIYEIIVGGAIGGGKTTWQMIMHDYNLMRVASLLNPHGVLGAAPNKGLVLSLFTITLPKTHKTLIEPFKALMAESKTVYEEVLDRREWKAGFPSFRNSEIIPFYDNTSELCLPNNISVMLGSQSSHALSFDMFGAFLDEAEFRDSGGDIDKAFEVYSNLKERVDSRFLDSRFKLVSLVSSARYSTGIIAQYTNSIPKDSKTSLYAAFPIWEIKSFDAYKDGSFHVLRGNSDHPSKIMNEREESLIETNEYVVPEGCLLLTVPKVYYDKFQFRVEDAIRNLAGMQTLGADQPFPNTDKIVNENLPAEFNLMAELPSSPDEPRIPLIRKLPAYLSKITPEGTRLIRYPGLARYAHVDLATVNVAGLTIMHKELHKDRTVYVTDLTCSIRSPKRIDINAIGDLINDLAVAWGVWFEVVSFDQFQSDAIRQRLELDGVVKKVILLSVDRTLGPYQEASRLVSSGQVKTGKADLLIEQMMQVELHPEKNSEKVKRGPAGKDQLDSFVGALYNAINAVTDVPQAEYIEEELIAHSDKRTEEIFENLPKDGENDVSWDLVSLS